MSAALADEFTIERVSIDLGNRNRFGEKPLGQADVIMGPWRFTIYVSPDGRVCLPPSLRDQKLRRGIAREMRAAVFDEIQTRWQHHTRREAEGAQV